MNDDKSIIDECRVPISLLQLACDLKENKLAYCRFIAIQVVKNADKHTKNYI